MRDNFHPTVYIMTNKRNGTLYTGVTSNLQRRVYQHKNPEKDSFTKRYNCTQLVYYARYEEMINAIERETQIKAGPRKKKLALIESMNPNWLDLYEELF